MSVTRATWSMRIWFTPPRRPKIALFSRAIDACSCIVLFAMATALRSTNPDVQIVEGLDRYQIGHRVEPFTRCIACNGMLATVSKGEIVDQLEPLTRLHFAEFRRCGECWKIFRRGSHYEKLASRVRDLGVQVRHVSALTNSESPPTVPDRGDSAAPGL
ncbi:MAG: Mut7-C RNAse domain-containing protein [Verrucomicrobiota bacterium]|nr:Mut7-C RNAse domain-containing protein [Verrucomicrobiota bacterium]